MTKTKKPMTEHAIDAIAAARAAFLAERKKGIGGSDVAAALGLDPYKTPVQLWAEKVGRADGELVNVGAARRGRFLEAAVGERYAQDIAVASIEPQVRHAAETGGWRRGNQDLRVIDAEGRRRCVEIKTVRRSVWHREWGDPWSDQIPDRALCQGLWYANLDDAAIVDFAVLVVPDDPDQVIGLSAEEIVSISKFCIYQAERDRKLEEQLIGAARSFWFDYVVANVAPPALTSEDVELLWAAQRAGEKVQADEETTALVREYAECSAAIKELGSRKDWLRDRLAVAAGPAETLVAPDGVTPLLTFKQVNVGAYQVAPKSYRRLNVTKWAHRYFEREDRTTPPTE